jgi:DNA-binding XRE family transcriptional regulator
MNTVYFLSHKPYINHFIYRRREVMKRKRKVTCRRVPMRLKSQFKMQGRTLRYLRYTNNLTQRRLASLVGCSQSLISAIETGRYNPKAELLQRIYTVCA